MIFTYWEYHNYFIYWQKTLTVKLNRTHEFIEKFELDWKLNEASWIMQYSLKICFSSTHARNKIKQINFEFMVFGLAGVNHFPTRVLVNLQKKFPNALNSLTRIFLNLPLCSFLLKFQFPITGTKNWCSNLLKYNWKIMVWVLPFPILMRAWDSLFLLVYFV